MKFQFVECQRAEIIDKKSDLLMMLDEFRESGKDCVKIVGFPHKNATNCARNIQVAIKRYRIKTVKCVRRGDNIYLVKVDI